MPLAGCRLLQPRYAITGSSDLISGKIRVRLVFIFSCQKTTEFGLTHVLTLAHTAPKGEKSHGTGFYVNIPDTKAHVILTAAHNLVDNQKKPSQDLQFYDPLQGAIIKPGDLEIFIPPSYLSRPRTETDFGAIRVPTSTSVPRGFGFALKLAEESLRDKTLQICGFPSDCPRPEPSTSSGDCKRWNRNRLEYQIATAKGLSGAPVFMPFKGHDTVIGIQCVFIYMHYKYIPHGVKLIEIS